MFLEIDDATVANWKERLAEMSDIYADEYRSDWFDADDIAKQIAMELAEVLEQSGI